jgi:hypothetical protein
LLKEVYKQRLYRVISKLNYLIVSKIFKISSAALEARVAAPSSPSIHELQQSGHRIRKSWICLLHSDFFTIIKKC